MRETEDQLGRLKTEARGLAQLTAPSTKNRLRAGAGSGLARLRL